MTIVVTGAGGAIGGAISRGFLADGATVLAVDLTDEGLKPLKELGAFTKIVDVADSDQVKEMVAMAVDRTGRLDVLFNNAGLGYGSSLTDDDPARIELLIRVNLLGPIWGMHHALPIMRKQNFGRIINMVSRAAEAAGPGMTAYSSSKAGLWAATRIVAKETKDENILVNGMIPGPTKSGMMPRGQDPSVVYPTARMLATLPDDGPGGKCFWNEKEYILYDENNETYQR